MAPGSRRDRWAKCCEEERAGDQKEYAWLRYAFSSAHVIPQPVQPFEHAMQRTGLGEIADSVAEPSFTQWTVQPRPELISRAPPTRDADGSARPTYSDAEVTGSVFMQSAGAKAWMCERKKRSTGRWQNAAERMKLRASCRKPCKRRIRTIRRKKCKHRLRAIRWKKCSRSDITILKGMEILMKKTVGGEICTVSHESRGGHRLVLMQGKYVRKKDFNYIWSWYSVDGIQ